MVGERLSAAGRFLDRGLARRLVDVVEDGPVSGLDLGLSVDGDLGEQVTGTVNKAALPQALREDHLGRADQARGAVGDDQDRWAQSALDQP
jgi:hypothetical protein